MTLSVSQEISRFVSSLKWQDVPTDVQDRVRDRFIDAVSTAIAGRNIDVTQVVARAATSSGHCTSLPDGVLRSAGDAALVNATSVHSILYEDIHPGTANHPGAVVVTACLAAAEEKAAEGQVVTIGDLLVGILVGYEVELALAVAIAPSVIRRGLRTTSILGTISAAAGAAKTRALDADQIAGAINIGANFAFGFLEGIALTGMEMYLHAGAASRAGVLAANLGAQGVVTTPLTFDGPNGYFNAFGPLNQSLKIGDKWRIMDVWCKAYPLSAAKQKAVDASIAAFEAGIRAHDIENVTVRMPPVLLAYPGADWRGPFTRFTQAQNSTQFCVAAALLGRDMEAIDTFTESFNAADIQALMQKIDLVAEADRASTGAEQVDITLRSGEIRCFADERPDGRVPSIAKMDEKLRKLSRGIWHSGTVDDVTALISGPLDQPVQALSDTLRRRID